MSMIGRTYLERGRPVVVPASWGPPIRPGDRPGPRIAPATPSGPAIPAHGTGPRNVLIRRAGGELVVRPFRGLRRLPEVTGR
ncbi:hypothetical protein AB0K60_07075 [Thermopolyspora sp. NPDC052614]|uniref:hypothetical protein n=1 Tax=Thermopolyspora sp. NPDC052614 TaxID=3155682 RepID=UPI00342F8D9A